VRSDRGTAIRALDIVEAVMRDPCEDVGSTDQHRLVCRTGIDFLQARYHY
jgi:hypothetical protein